MAFDAPQPGGVWRPYVDILLTEDKNVNQRAANAGPPTVNADELMDRLDGDREFLVELTELFRRDYPRQVNLIRQAIDQGSAPGLKQASHALKGALSSLSACEAREIAAHLEEMGATSNLQGARAALHDLERELVKTIASLESICREAGR
jgi:two-component system sensor histidine kinase/response regulator